MLLNTDLSLQPLNFCVNYTFVAVINDITKSNAWNKMLVLAYGSRDKVHNVQKSRESHSMKQSEMIYHISNIHRNQKDPGESGTTP